MTLYARLQAVMAKHPKLSPPEALNRAVVAHRLFLLGLECDRKHPDAFDLADRYLQERERAVEPSRQMNLLKESDDAASRLA